MSYLDKIDNKDREDARIRRKILWLFLLLVLAIGITSGIYVGGSRTWDGLSGSVIKEPGPPSVPSQEEPTSQPEASDNTQSKDVPENEEMGDADSVSKEIELWKLVSSSNQTVDYENYLQKYPNGRYAAIAKLRVERLQAAAKTAQASPESANASASKPQSATPLPRIELEEAAWSKASTINSPAAYQEYLHEYPKGSYAALALERIASMSIASASQVPRIAESTPLATTTTTRPATDNSVENRPTTSPNSASPVSPSINQTDVRYVTQGFAKLDLLPTGSAAVSAPENVRLGDSFIVYLRVSPGDVASLKRSLEEDLKDDLPENIVGATKPGVTLSKYMEAHLEGNGFSVKPLVNEKQVVSSTGATTWQWEVTSSMFGTRTLNFSLSCYIPLRNNEEPHGCYFYPLKVKVAVSPWPLLQEHWKWIITSILIPLIAGIWILYKHFKTSQNTKPNLANKVRERMIRRKFNESK